jgi:hypothetical protein
VALEDELLEQANRHSKPLQGMCLLEHDNRREHHPKNADPPIFDGIPLYCTTGPYFRACESMPPSPPPSPCGKGTRTQNIFVDRIKPKDEDS